MLRFLLVVALLAGTIYLTFWTLERRRAAGQAQRQHPSARPTRRQARKFVAPDDDEDFLRDLERKRRQEDGPG